MDRKARKQFGSAGNIAIKGTGCVLSNAQNNAFDHRKGGQNTTTKTTKTAMLHKTGSFANLDSTQMDYNNGSNKNTHKNCRCHQILDGEQSAMLHDQYTRNLHQQIYLLELENNYLRKKDGKQLEVNDEPMIGSDDDQLNIPGPSRQTRCPIKYKKPSSGNDDEHHHHIENQQSRYATKKKVSYADPEVIELRSSPTRSILKPNSSDVQTDLLQKLEDAYQRVQKLEERLRLETEAKAKNIDEKQGLERRLNELEATHCNSEESFTRDRRALMEEIVELQRRLDYLTPALATKETFIAKLESEKDSLNVKLRSVISERDDLHCEIREKNRELAAQLAVDAGNEHTGMIEMFQKAVERLENEVTEYKNKQLSLIDEIASTRRLLREEQLTAKKDRAIAEKTLEENSQLIKENSQLSAQNSRLELNIANQQKPQTEDRQTPMEFNSKQIVAMFELEKTQKLELSRLKELLQSERERQRRVEQQMLEYEESERGGFEARSRMQNELDALKALSESLSNENKMLRQEKFTLNERCDELLKKNNSLNEQIKNCEFDSSPLKRRNDDLLNEVSEKSEQLRLLREENEELSIRTRELQDQMSENEADYRECKQHCDAIRQQYERILHQLDEMTVQHKEKGKDYDALVHKVMELHEFLKNDPKSSPTSQVAAAAASVHSWSPDISERNTRNY